MNSVHFSGGSAAFSHFPSCATTAGCFVTKFLIAKGTHRCCCPLKACLDKASPRIKELCRFVFVQKARGRHGLRDAQCCMCAERTACYLRPAMSAVDVAVERFRQGLSV